MVLQQADEDVSHHVASVAPLHLVGYRRNRSGNRCDPRDFHQERFGVAEQVEFVKLNNGSGDYLEAIQAKAGVGEITYVSVPDTFYSFVLLNGAVQPLVLDVEKREVWHITGLGTHF